jgi:hypothetical protein
MCKLRSSARGLVTQNSCEHGRPDPSRLSEIALDLMNMASPDHADYLLVKAKQVGASILFSPTITT